MSSPLVNGLTIQSEVDHNLVDENTNFYPKNIATVCFLTKKQFETFHLTEGMNIRGPLMCTKVNGMIRIDAEVYLKSKKFPLVQFYVEAINDNFFSIGCN